MNTKEDKIKTIASFIEETLEAAPTDLGDENLYLEAAEDALTNKPRIWQDAMIYLRLLNRHINRLDTLEILDGRIAFLAYAAKYKIETGKEKNLDELLPIFYNPQQATKVDVTDLDNFDHLFEYPHRIEFTPAAHEEIIRRILNDEMSSEQIDFYLGTEESSDFGYSKLYPALKHILLTTTDAHLFWTAGDVLAIIWRLLPDSNKELDSWFNQELYDIFWPRVHDSSLRLLTSEKQIFNDSLSWVVNNPDCKKLNPELWQKLEKLAQDETIGPEDIDSVAVFGQVCNIRTQRLAPAKKFDFVAKYCKDEDLYSFFCRPETIEEAEIYLEKAFDEYRFSPEECQEIVWNDDDPRRSYWRKTVEAHKVLLEEPLTPEVQDFVLQYIVDNFDRVSWRDNSSAMQLLWAACTGAVKQSQPREAFAAKCRELLASQSLDTTPVDAALELAQANISFRSKQEADLVKNLRRYAEKAGK